jgi:hypothetical protein
MITQAHTNTEVASNSRLPLQMYSKPDAILNEIVVCVYYVGM